MATRQGWYHRTGRIFGWYDELDRIHGPHSHSHIDLHFPNGDKGNTRTAVLEAKVAKHDEEIDDMHDSYKENFARIFKSLEDIKIRLERMDASRNK